jgi:hypothetical protein
MFHIGRCGSTVVAGMLQRHPLVLWQGELFEPVNGKFKPGMDPWALLGEALAEAAGRIYGFEFKFFAHCQLTGAPLAEVVDRLKDQGFEHFVVLRRRNLLRRMASALVGRRTGTYHLRKERHAKLMSITIDTDRVFDDLAERPLLQCFEAFEAGFEDLSRLLDGLKVLHLTYEEDIEGGPGTGYARICEYLGIDAVPVPVPFTRMNPFPLRDIIMNFGDVEKALAGTPFAWMTRD